ncbi:type II-A CRISPR-associated protein Csn2 [Lactobacillus crispatus]|uniref:Type II-A CRISPR-associated protein Csn2 n=1 Tax=Lactobacillus crispatus TaxID=47770 RepID=A0A2N5KX92_9LACO|nr:type II-A CRISPR-associated protein Csn2 [Lactobacillus crispatus]MBI1721514.1 type II-A CRISPR-associated protein Csn2 [Lactobacillus crispatus]PLT10862.1 type II-A CRISPR-associated protein Csn2 [Lactobacillus crispatus]QLL73886.1 type II-A CRISPR-associated protein Csn2 [Lactobacillus crispatus]
MIVSYLSHKKICLKDGINVICTQSPIAYKDLVLGFQALNDLIVCSDDEYNNKSISKSFDFVGDPLLNDNIMAKYMNVIIKNFISNLDEVNRNRILKSFYSLETVLNDSLLLEDLPLEIDFSEDIKKLLKMVNIHLDAQLMLTPYAIIETVLKIHQEYNLDSIPVFCNVAHYLDETQLKELSKIVRQLKLKIILIEFTDKQYGVAVKDAQVAYIDRDLVDWY